MIQIFVGSKSRSEIIKKRKILLQIRIQSHNTSRSHDRTILGSCAIKGWHHILGSNAATALNNTPGTGCCSGRRRWRQAPRACRSPQACRAPRAGRSARPAQNLRIVEGFRFRIQISDLVQGYHGGWRLHFVDFELVCSSVCPILLGRLKIWAETALQMRNPGSRSTKSLLNSPCSPCTG